MTPVLRAAHVLPRRRRRVVRGPVLRVALHGEPVGLARPDGVPRARDGVRARVRIRRRGRGRPAEPLELVVPPRPRGLPARARSSRSRAGTALGPAPRPGFLDPRGPDRRHGGRDRRGLRRDRGSRCIAHAQAAARRRLPSTPLMARICRLMFRWGNIWFGITLMAAIGVSVAAGTFLENRFGTKGAQYLVYRSPWFGAIFFTGGIAMLCATFRKYPFRLEQAGWLTVHTGLALVVIGGMTLVPLERRRRRDDPRRRDGRDLPGRDPDAALARRRSGCARTGPAPRGRCCARSPTST